MKMRLFIYLFMIVCLFSCREEEWITIDVPEQEAVETGWVRSVVSSEASALTQDDDGYWYATRRVPLVGAGRIVDNVSDALIGVANWTDTENSLDFLTDMDIDNSFSFGGVVAAQAITNQLASVRDMVHTYGGGQSAGFVYRLTDEGLLTLDVLKGFWIDTYLKGEKQEHAVITNESGVLGLSLISIASNDGKQALSISTSLEKPFDEIRIGISGVDVAAVASGLELFYAFVGDNPICKATTDNTKDFPNGVSINKKAGMTGVVWTPEKIIDPDTESNGGTIELLSALLQPFVTVNLQREVPAGTEVGFCVSGGGLLDLDLLGVTVLKTFDENDEEQESYTFGSLLGLSLIHGSNDQMYSLRLTKPCSQIQLGLFGLNVQLLSAKVIKYAYIREGDIIDASSYVSYPDVTVHSSAHRFAQPEEGTVSFDILSMPAGSTAHIEDGKIVGMNANGPHLIQATYVSTEGDRYTQTFTVTLDKTSGGMSNDCNILISETAYDAEAYIPEGGGSLISFEGGDEKMGNLTNEDKNDYVKYSSGLSLAGNYGILGIRLADGQSINAEGHEIRTGFVIRDDANVLNLTALRFFRVRLLKDGEYVSQNNGEDVSDENATVSIGLIGGTGSGNKKRMSIVTDVEFDAIELWTSGVLNLDLHELEIYHAFWERADAGCASPEEECMELITAGSYGATINYAETGYDGVASVGTSFGNLGNLVDDDIESYADVNIPVNVGGQVTVAVKFNTVMSNQEVGIILQDVAGVASVDLIKWITLTVYHNGVEVGSSGQGGALDLKVIGYGGKQYLSLLPSTQEFNELRISFGGVVDALKNFRLNGLYLRPDTDGDGVIDCVEPLPEPSFTSIEVTSEHICVPEEPEFNVVGGQDGASYRLHFNDVSPNNRDFICTATLDTDTQRFTYTETINFLPGDYYVGIYDGADTQCEGTPLYNGVHVSIHPSFSTWVGSASDDWNSWDNWTEGVPWECTDVVLPAGCKYYPVLEEDELNCCNRIRFCTDSELINSPYLRYASAWVDVTLASNRYHLLSMPLKDVYSGDLFIAADNRQIADDYPVLDESSYPQNRFAPSVYQRKWQQEVEGVMSDGTRMTVPIQGNGWTKPYNSVDELYAPGEGFSFWIDYATDEDFVFRFPKKHTSYNYYRQSDQSVASTPAASISRTEAGGRFITENEGNATSMPFRVTLERDSSGDVFVAGNPFMAHIDIHRLIAGNPGVKAVKRYGGEKNIPNAGDYLLEELYGGLISPMEAFYVLTEEDAVSVTLQITEEMIYQYNGFKNRME